MQIKKWIACSVVLLMGACQAGQNISPVQVPESTQNSLQTAVSEPLSTKQMASQMDVKLQVQNQAGYETAQIEIHLPSAFRTQFATGDSLAFIQLQLQGEGLREIYTHEGNEFLAVGDETLTATISRIPINDGALRVVTVYGYDANQNRLDAFEASGYYHSAARTDTVDVVLNRNQLLLGRVLQTWLANDPGVISDWDLSALQDYFIELLGYRALPQEFENDPHLFDPEAVIRELYAAKPEYPDPDILLEEAMFNRESVSLDIHLPSGAGHALDETIYLMINDPLSPLVALHPGTLHGSTADFGLVSEGQWRLSAYDQEGNQLLTSSVAVTGTELILADNPLLLTGSLDTPVE